MDKPIEEMQKDHTSDSEHGDGEEKNSHVEGEADGEMHDVGDVVKNIFEDGSPIIGNQNIDYPDDEEEEDHSMSVEDEDEDQENVLEDEQNENMPKTKPTYDAGTRTIGNFNLKH